LVRQGAGQPGSMPGDEILLPDALEELDAFSQEALLRLESAGEPFDVRRVRQPLGLVEDQPAFLERLSPRSHEGPRLVEPPGHGDEDSREDVDPGPTPRV